MKYRSRRGIDCAGLLRRCRIINPPQEEGACRRRLVHDNDGTRDNCYSRTNRHRVIRYGIPRVGRESRSEGGIHRCRKHLGIRSLRQGPVIFRRKWLGRRHDRRLPRKVVRNHQSCRRNPKSHRTKGNRSKRQYTSRS